MNKILLRIILDIILFSSAVMGILWIIFPLGIICSWYNKKYFEFVLSAFVFDIIFSTPRDKLFNFQFVYSLLAILIFIIIVFLKSKIRKDLWQKSF